MMNDQVPFIKTSNNSGKGLLVFLVILLFVISLSLGGYIVYLKLFTKEVKTVTKETSEALEQVQLEGGSLLEVEDIINTFEYAYNDSFSNYFGYIYSSDKIDASNFDAGAALFACLYPDLEESPNVSYVANNTVRTRYKSIFGEEAKYTPKNVSAGVGYDINYDPINKYFAYQRVSAGGYFYPTYVTFNDTTSISSEKVIITKRVAYLEYSTDHTTINVFSDKDKDDQLGVIGVSEGSFDLNEITAKFKSSLAQYKYVFVKDKDSFVFDSIERIN